MNETLKVPDGWCCVNHIDIAKINPKFDIKQFKEDIEVSFLPMASVEEISGNYDLSQSRKLSAVKKGYTQFKNGDLIFAKITPCMENGKIAVLDNLLNGIGFGSTEFHVSRPYHNINAQFLFYYFVQSAFRKKAQRTMTGSVGHLRVTTEYFKNVNIPLPPLSEQRAIVSKIEQLFSDLDNGIENFKKAQEQLKIYRQAVLKKAFEGEFTKKWREEQTVLLSAEELLQQVKDEREEHYQKQLDEWEKTVKEWEDNNKEGKKPTAPKKLKEIPQIENKEYKDFKILPYNWKWIRLANVVIDSQSNIVDGPFGSNLKSAEYVEKGKPVLRIQNIKSNKFIDKNIKYVTEEKFNSLHRHQFKSGDLIVTKLGDPLGLCCRVPKKFDEGLIVADLIRIKPSSENINYDWLIYLINSQILQGQFRKITKGTTRPRMNLTIMRNIILPLCSIQEQSQIVQEIETRLSICDKIEEIMTESLKKAESLRQSILKRAFEGKLLNEKELEEVRNAPDWEPAEKLLERIKAEKTNTKASKGKK